MTALLLHATLANVPPSFAIYSRVYPYIRSVLHMLFMNTITSASILCMYIDLETLCTFAAVTQAQARNIFTKINLMQHAFSLAILTTNSSALLTYLHSFETQEETLVSAGLFTKILTAYSSQDRALQPIH